MKNSSSEKSADESRLDGQRMGKKVASGSGKVGAQCPNPWNARGHSLSTYRARSKITRFAGNRRCDARVATSVAQIEKKITTGIRALFFSRFAVPGVMEEVFQGNFTPETNF